MSSQTIYASVLMACLLTLGFGGPVRVANAAPAGLSVAKPGAGEGSNVIQIKRRRGSRRTVFPIAPSYQAYDYPYYYSRGYYPRHIGRGYVYYGQPYLAPRGYYRRSYTPVSATRCSTWRRKCGANWGRRNADYYGCMQHHGC